MIDLAVPRRQTPVGAPHPYLTRAVQLFLVIRLILAWSSRYVSGKVLVRLETLMGMGASQHDKWQQPEHLSLLLFPYRYLPAIPPPLVLLDPLHTDI